MSDLKIFTDLVEPEAIEQINKLIEQDVFKDCKIRIMPDVHTGVGCVIGFTADLGDKVIPNIVGVDIGCGMLTVKLGKTDIDLDKLDRIIRKYIPYGKNVHDSRFVKFDKLKDLYCYRELKDTKRIERSIGTLGGGNHFIEVDIDTEDNKYLIIHSGSRNLGKQVAIYYQNLAIDLMRGKDEILEKQKKLIEEYKNLGKKKDIQKAIKELHKTFKARELNIPKELCYLKGEYREQYLHDMKICQEYASLNRRTMSNLIIDNYSGLKVQESFETIHNYIDHKSNIVRKGAISAKKGEKLLIPINMKDGCIIGIGKGNEDWNCSAPHGAGRLMSRTKAKETLNLEDYQETMMGIYSTCIDFSTIDEAPMAYKPIESIIDNIKDTVEIISIIKPIYNFKASE
jgi:tRNA-splicing ligase RtcB